MKKKMLSGVLVLVAAMAGPALADKRIDDAVAKAEEQIRKGKSPEEALKGLQKLVAQEPGNIEALLALGRMQFRLGNRDDAGQTYARATEQAGASTGAVAGSAYAQHAMYELARGSASQALKLAEAGVKADSNAETLAALAQAQARTGDALKALETAEKAIAAGPNASLPYQAKALALATLDRLADAVNAARRATELDPQSVAAKTSLAFMLTLDNKPQEAVPIAQAAKQGDFKPAEAYAVLGLAMAKANPADWSSAIGEVQEGALFESKSPLILYCRGQLFEMQSNMEEAVRNYREATSIDPQFGPASYALVFALYQAGHPKEALVEAQKLAKTAPKNGQLQLILGELLLRNDDFAGAIDPLQKAVVLLPNSADGHYFLALALTRTNAPQDQAATHYCKASTLAPSKSEYRIACGLSLVRAEQFDQGIEQLKQVASDPSYKGAEAWINLGYAYTTMDPPKFAEAAEAYKTGLSRIDAKTDTNTKVQALIGLARACDSAQRFDEAIAAYKETAKADPNYAPLAAVRTAVIEFKKGAPKRDLTAAKAALETAKGIAGDDNPILVKLAEAITAAEKPTGTPGPGPDGGLEVVDPGRCIRTLQGKSSTAAKIRAVQDLKSLGREGAEHIANYALYYQNDIDVREAAINALIALKGAACAAAKQIKMMGAMDIVPCTDCDRATMERELRLGDVIKKARALGATCK